MPQIVEVPGFGDVEFPDGMSDEQIAAAIKANMQPAAPAKPAGPPIPPPRGTMPLGMTPQAAGASMFMPQGMGNLMDAAGVTAEAKPSDVIAMGPEVALQGATGLLGTAVGGLAGIGQGLLNKVGVGTTPAADRVQQVQQAMTYQPKTAGGQLLSKTASIPGEIWGAGTNKVGEVVSDVTGLPSLGAGIKTLGDIAPALIPALAASRGGPKGPRPNEKFVDTKNSVPTTGQIKKASQDAYKEGEAAGVVVPVDSYAQALTSVREMVTKEGIDPTLHPKTTAVMKRLEESAGKPLTLQEAETLRKIALDAEDDLNPVTRQPTPDARLAGKVVDELDDRIDALSTNSEARALWARSRRSQMIDRAIERAEIKAGAHYTQAGMEHALRQEFKQLALNERRMRGLTADQKAAIKKVANGGPLENTLRALGKFDPTSSPVAAISSLGSSALLASVNPAAAALPIAGWVSKRGATKMTERNVEKAREALVGRGMPSSLAGLLAKGDPKPLVGGQRGLLGEAAPRSAAELRSEIASLDAEVQRLQAAGPAASTVRASVEAELARLRRELEAAEARGARP